MLEILTSVFLLTSLSLIVQKSLNIPSPITLIVVVLFLKFFDMDIFIINDKIFDQIIFFLLPLLITVDAIQLKLEDIKKNKISLFYVAVVSVSLAVIIGAFISIVILPQYSLSIAAGILLFCMVTATDPVAVSSVFSNFKLPHGLKFIVEGESLLNDAYALVIFGIALNFLDGSMSTDLVTISMHSFGVVFGAITIGFACGIVGLYLLKLTKDPVVETSIILSISYAAFLFAEHFHWSGILSIIVGVITANHVITKYIDKDNEIIEKIEHQKQTKLQDILRLDNAISDKANHGMIIKFIQFLGAIGVTFLIISIGEIINFSLITHYWKEIVFIFLISTLLRAMMMLKFSFISNSTQKMKNINVRWLSVLTFAGVKGGLSILMIHMIPNSFEHKEMFEAVVLGNILLSTFLYSVFLIFIIGKYKDKFEKEMLEESH